MKTYKLIWRLIRYRPWLYLCNGIMWTLVHVTPVIPGLISREFFDTLSGHARLGLNIWGLVALTIGFALARVMVIVGGANLDILHRFNMSALLRRNMLANIMNQPAAEELAFSQGEILNRFQADARQAEDSISWTLDVIGSATFALTAVAILLSINAKITLLVFTPMVIVVATSRIASERVEKYRKASRAATGQVSGMLGEIFSSVQAVKVSGAEKHILKHFNNLNEVRSKLTLRDSVLTQLLESIYENTVSIGTGLILLLAAGLMRDKTFTVGDFSLFIYYLSFVAEFTHFFGSFLAHYQQTGVSFERMAEVVAGGAEELVKANPLYITEDLPEVHSPAKSAESTLERLEVRGLTYHYAASGGGVTDISFTVPGGSFTVITGRIGSGKSTLLRTLLGLLPRQAGEICWNGVPLADPAKFFQPPHSAYTPQIPHLFSDTVRENILMGLNEEQIEIDTAIRRAVFTEDVPELEQGLETVIGPKGVKLSGGQVQRVAAARMFAREPEIFVFDDISSALDVETENRLWQDLFLHPDATCLVVSNRRAALQHADHIIVLKNGQVEAEGTLAQVLQVSPEMRLIWGTGS